MSNCSPETVCESVKMKCKQLWLAISSTRFLIVTTTSILVITGLLFLTMGIVAIAMVSEYFMYIEDTYYYLAGSAIAVAIVIFLIAIFGYYAVTKAKYDFVVAYLTLLVAILLIETMIMALGYVLDGIARNGGAIDHMNFRLQMNFYIEHGGNAYDWTLFQMKFKCCGYDGVSDFGNKTLPFSCCYYYRYQSSECYRYYDGCYDSLGIFISDYTLAMAIGSTVATFLQVMIIAITAGLAYRIKSQQEVPYKEVQSPVEQESKANYYSQYHIIPGANVENITKVHGPPNDVI